MFRHDCPLAVKPASTQKTWRDYLLIDMLLSAVSVLVVVQPSSEFPEGLSITLYIWGCMLLSDPDEARSSSRI
jgi:hypothetical protein